MIIINYYYYCLLWHVKSVQNKHKSQSKRDARHFISWQYNCGVQPHPKHADPDIRDWPWMVVVVSDKGGIEGGVCGGTLINSRWIVTSKICIDNYFKNDTLKVSVPNI